MKLLSIFQPDRDSKCYPIQGVVRLVSTLTGFGVPAREILQGSRVLEKQLDTPETRVSFNQIQILFENAVRLSPQADIGLLATRQAHFSDFGVIGYTLISARTMADAFELGLRYLRMACPVTHISIAVEDNIARIEGSQFQVPPALLPIYSEIWLGTVAALCEDVSKQPLDNLCLHLPYPDPGYAESYRAHFNCPVVFDAPVLRLEFDPTSLYETAPYSSALVLEKCVQSCESILASLKSEDAVVHQVKATLLENPGQFPDATEVAKALGLSVRSLARKLTESGHSFQSVLNETRKDMALQYLQQTSMSVPEIAAQVGFSDAANFRKAFKKWTGAAPATFRPE